MNASDNDAVITTVANGNDIDDYDDYDYDNNNNNTSNDYITIAQATIMINLPLPTRPSDATTFGPFYSHGLTNPSMNK